MEEGERVELYFWATLAMVLFPILGIVLGYVGISAQLVHADSQNWPSVQGTITKSKLSESTVRAKYKPSVVVYSLDVQYQYQVQGTSYTSNDLGFNAPGSSADKALQNAILKRKYPQGGRVTVYYNPDAPGKAMLDRTMRKGLGWEHLAISLSLISAGPIFYLIRRFALKKKPTQPVENNIDT